MSSFDGTFVTALNANGEPQEIPAAWLDDPVLGAGFTLAAPPVTNAGGDDVTPSKSWTLQTLKAYAVTHGIPLGDAVTKTQVFDAITTQTPTSTPDVDETPAAGDDKEN